MLFLPLAAFGPIQSLLNHEALRWIRIDQPPHSAGQQGDGPLFRELEGFIADLGAAVSKRVLEARMRMTEYEKRLLFWLGIIVAIVLTWNITTAYLL